MMISFLEKGFADRTNPFVKEETGLHINVKGICSISEAFFEERDHHAIFFNSSISFGLDIYVSPPIISPRKLKKIA
jgi:hypothetical protein